MITLALIFGLQFTPPEDPVAFNKRITDYITPEVQKYVLATVGILGFKMLIGGN